MSKLFSCLNDLLSVLLQLHKSYQYLKVHPVYILKILQSLLSGFYHGSQTQVFSKSQEGYLHDAANSQVKYSIAMWAAETRPWETSMHLLKVGSTHQSYPIAAVRQHRRVGTKSPNDLREAKNLHWMKNISILNVGSIKMSKTTNSCVLYWTLGATNVQSLVPTEHVRLSNKGHTCKKCGGLTSLTRSVFLRGT